MNNAILLKGMEICAKDRKRTPTGYGCTKGVTTDDIIQVINYQTSSLDGLIKKMKDHLQGLIELRYSTGCGRLTTTDIKKAVVEEMQKLKGTRKKLLLQKEQLESRQKRSVFKVNLLVPESHTEAYRDFLDALQYGIYLAASMANNKKTRSMLTFCCENCQEPVTVPKDMLKDELRFKCQACHQENHYDLS